MQKVIQEKNLIANAQAMGNLLGGLLKERVGSHPNVGDIRGRGLFWAIEFVQDKSTKSPFPAKSMVAMGISELALSERYSMMFYPGAGTADGVNGDHVIIAPPYTVTAEDIEYIVETAWRVIADYFSQLAPDGHSG